MKTARGWTELKRTLQDGGLPAGRVLLGLDFDGTLAPLARRPASAAIPLETKRLLRRLGAKRNLRVAVVSGRSLKDVRLRTGIRGIHYAGNHGLEVLGPGQAWTHPAARAAKPQIARAARSIRAGLPRSRGFLLEDKGLSLSLHYREAKSPDAAQSALGIAAKAVKPFPRRLRLASGKKVWEIRPAARWNKGDALLKIAGFSGKKHGSHPETHLVRENADFGSHARREDGGVLEVRGRPNNEAGGQKPRSQAQRGFWMASSIIFVGDDMTDEEGFRTLGRRAITVRVGSVRGTRARFCLRGQRQVQKLLELLCRVLA